MILAANNGNNTRLLTSYPNKTIKTFLIEDFFPFATGVNNIGGAP
jgi:hypothetical protein